MSVEQPGNTDVPRDYYGLLIGFICQVPVFMALAIFIDYKIANSFKGYEASNVVVQERLQLDERQDVVSHRDFSHRVWETSNHNGEDYLIQCKNLYKVYKNGIAAINNNSFSVK